MFNQLITLFTEDMLLCAFIYLFIYFLCFGFGLLNFSQGLRSFSIQGQG